MPVVRMSSSSSQDEVEEKRTTRRYPRRSAASKEPPTNKSPARDDENPEEEDENYAVDPAESISEDEALEADVDDDDVGVRRRSKRRRGGGRSKQTEEETVVRRTSTRSNKFKDSMREPAGESVRDLFQASAEGKKQTKNSTSTPTSRRRGRPRKILDAGSDNPTTSEESSDSDSSIEAPKRRSVRSNTKKTSGRQRQTTLDSLVTATSAKHHKSPARRHVRARRSVKKKEESEDDYSFEEPDDSSDEEGEDEEPDLKIQRIVAVRSEPRAKWLEICKNMNTSEITDGSRWFQSEDDDDDDDDEDNKSKKSEKDDNIIEERFLVKWADLSYLHTSWETQQDLIEETDGAKTYISTFFRKSFNGLLFSQDERCDGDYFDPSLVQIDRILMVGYDYDDEGRTKKTKRISTAAEEDACVPSDLGIITDRTHPDFESGTGRQFLVKWESSTYTETSYEFERDLIINEVEYKDKLKELYRRAKKPNKKDTKQRAKKGEESIRRHYKIFGDKSKMNDVAREKEVQAYQNNLSEHVYPNGGQLRDYQAEGIAWMVSNYVNQRSCILADEMGLGKTLQTAAFIDLVVNKFHRPGPFLIIVPLSTTAHWQREFTSWTNLNVIVYHGSAEDRRLIREFEFAFECDRPNKGVGANQLYLKKCSKTASTWMTQVVITTPEMVVADDCAELTAVRWEVLVVDEAHRLKNHNSKLAVNLRKDFQFKHKILLTGTPIQNEVKEFWTLLNFIDPKGYGDMDKFLELYGDIKSKERIDELHENIRPYILRRLKEDVEKSVPPKEETLIEVELTILQKQYYRALYERNVKFLHKNKKKALDGPSLNNLAMQLRKCCNHLFLLNGVEEELRKDQMKDLGEADFLVRGSGKLVLLDKLLPRLKEKGHRLLLFSQFKIMLDILEDYLHLREMKFERIDGSITGRKRQQAIDRFQSSEGKEPPFIMLLSTRAGGVGINLTAADTCIIFDSDWNPQNDLQAQARCHRIGQTKSVKVYRLLSRKSYEMQMFHMSSLKMGLDQAVLKGFESSASGESSMTKDEVERLLRHGAYDIFNEDKAGTAEAESNEFVQQDIDSILERRSRTVVHNNTGSESNAAGGTFSKASFKAPRTPDGTKNHPAEDIDIEDPEFWTKMVGEAPVEAVSDLKPRKRNKANYSEKMYERRLEAALSDSGSDKDSSSVYSSGDDDSSDEDLSDSGLVRERAHWAGSKGKSWKREQADNIFQGLETYGYGNLPWSVFHSKLTNCKFRTEDEVKRMSWSMLLLAICECATDDAAGMKKRAERAAERKREEAGNGLTGQADVEVPSEEVLLRTAFQKLWEANASWIRVVLSDAVSFAKRNQARVKGVLEQPQQDSEISALFYSKLWPALIGRGWKEEVDARGKQFIYNNRRFPTPNSVLNQVLSIHNELTNMVLPILQTLDNCRRRDEDREKILRERHLQLDYGNADVKTLRSFLQKYAPLPFLVDRKSSKKISLNRRVLSACSHMQIATKLVARAEVLSGDRSPNSLMRLIQTDPRSMLPHPLWTPKHDTILIYAIQKHGWIDREKSCRAIMADPDIKWGLPFEISDNSTDKFVAACDGGKLDMVKKTALRAAEFLNSNADLLEELKGCNQDFIIESYGLKKTTIENDGSSEPTKSEWMVDDKLLQHALTGQVEEDSGDGPLDLPAKKDLAKRAKRVLLKAVSTLLSGAKGVRKSSSSDSNAESPLRVCGYSIIDQGDRCCILLAEMVRGILKASQARMARNVRFLCSIAFEEALDLQKLFEKSFESNGANGTKVKGQEMKKIKEQLALVKRSLKPSPRQAKNVLRVMLGADPLPPKNPSDGIFPIETTLQKESDSARENRQDTPRRDDGALGERAIIRAMKRAYYDKNGGPCTFSLFNNSELGLPLTMIETLILFTFCTEGIPVKLPKHVAEDGLATDMQQKYALDWDDIGNVLEIAAKDYHQCAVDKLTKVRSAFRKVEAHPDNSATKVQSRKKLEFCEHDEAAKRIAAQQAEEFASQPDKLAKKSIMALEKVRRFGGTVTPQSKNNHKLENGLGPKVPVWFGKELGKWAKDFEIADGTGRPLAYTTKELLDSKPELMQTPVASILDKKACKQVSNQVALLTRLRSLFLKNVESQAQTKLVQAVRNSRKVEDSWDKRPTWWSDSSDDSKSGHNFLLLKRLAEHGFLNVLADASGFGPPDMVQDPSSSLKDLGLSKAVIQQRVNQLVRELHVLDESEEMMRLLKERRNRVKKKDSDRPRADNGPSRAGVQTGLHAFFVTTKTVSKKEKVVILSDNETDPSKTDSVKQGKRKVISDSEQTSSSAEKKSRNSYADMCEIDSSNKGKRKDDGDNALSESSTPEKKHRTLVDVD